MDDFVGAKAAVLFEDKLLVYLRDNNPGLRFANMWDFPGGGREGNESPLETLTREMQEEFSIRLKPDSVIWQKEFPAMHDPGLRAYFFVVRITKEDVDNIQFGEEGQRWEFMSTDSFLNREDAVPHLKIRLSDYLASKVGAF